MGNPKGFLKVQRHKGQYRPVAERVKDHKEVTVLRSDAISRDQASRCMDCGTPFCQWGCPIGNYIPEWNDLVYNRQWERAYELLSATNNIPEITGRICPNPCEFSCVLGINDDPVTIRENELAVIEHAFKNGLVKPRIPRQRTGKKIAVIGSGPAGLACADQLNQAGHLVTVYESEQEIGGLLRYGIPAFKLDKKILDRRLAIWRQEGIVFKTGVNVGENESAHKIVSEHDAVCLAGGSRVPRDLKVPGRELKGIHFAMEYLIEPAINAKGKKVVVIGGGDTGADCVGTANRQGAASVIQIEILPEPPKCRTAKQPWPTYPQLLKTTSSHEEGCERRWEVGTKKFTGENGQVKKMICDHAGKEIEIETDLVLLALGFLHPKHEGLLTQLGVEFDPRGNVKTDNNYQTSVKGVFTAGDMHRGQSLVVWAIDEGRQAAAAIGRYLGDIINQCPTIISKHTVASWAGIFHQLKPVLERLFKGASLPA